MKPVMVIVAVAGLAISGGIAASAQSATSSTGVEANAQANAVIDRYLTSVQAELTGKVDTKNAAVGQEVTARTTQTARLADGTTLPKGTKLVGHVTSVQAQDKNAGRSGSLLAITFDHAEMKGGQTLQLRTVMQAVAPPTAMAMGDNSTMSAPTGPINAGTSNSGSTRGGLSTGVGSGGGLGGPIGSGGQRTGSVGRTAGSTVGAATTDTGAALGSATQATGGAVRSAGESVSTAPRATALPGVMLSTAATADASGTLIAPNKNISLDTGTQITLGVIVR
jgi:hypothetical protein